MTASPRLPGPQAEGPGVPSAVSVEIMVEKLSLTIAGTPILSNVSFSVRRGETIGIVGESGSGKSTLLRVLAGLIGGWGGEVAIAGRKPWAQTGERLAFARTVQMVFQDPYGSLHPRQTVDRALREPLAIHGQGERDRTIIEALGEVGLDRAHRWRFPHQLSGGQRQRVAIARALILKPRILLLDEPTSALDVSVQAEILALLERLQRDHGLTSIFVSHNLPVVARQASRILVMAQGHVVEEIGREAVHARTAEHPATRALIAAATHRPRNAR